MKPIWKHIIAAICAMLVVAYCVFGVWMSKHQHVAGKCPSLVVEIDDMDERCYVTEIEIKQLVIHSGLYPVGKDVSVLPLQAIEDAVRKHDVVRNAECFCTIQGNVHIRLTQRVPLVRIVSGQETYFIDTDRKVLPVRESIKTPVLMVTGDISRAMAKRQISDFALWLQENAYWNKRIARVEVCSPRMIHLVQYDGLQKVILGDWNGAEQKLKKLRHWYDKGSGIDTQQFSMVDVRFRGQVIGIKN